MEMQQVRYFLALARTLNFTRAAEECNVSQPSLTRAIQMLEAELGGELLRRERGKSHLTELGKRMLPLLGRCYESALHAKTLASAINNQDFAPLTLAVSHTVNLEVIMESIAGLFGGLPGVQLSLRHGGGEEILGLLKDGAVELAVAGPLDDGWNRLDRWTLYQEPYALAMADAAALNFANDLSLDKLDGTTVFFQSGCEVRMDVMRRLEENGVKPTATHEVVTLHDLFAMVERGLGLAIVPASAPVHPGVRRTVLSDHTLNREVSAYAVAGRRRDTAAGAPLYPLRRAGFFNSATTAPPA
ncbi:MAG TPA: transcriptional regulator, partial [Alphaproteobacteria bacterium]|nr:transcriptional regulator [Alphaproteobacteria bacterium]